MKMPNLKRIPTTNEIWLDPAFVHKFGWDNESENRLMHEYKGSFARHRSVEKVLLKLRVALYDYDAVPGWKLADVFIAILLGLNCGFPARDIALYVPWYLRGAKPLRVFKGMAMWQVEELLEKESR